MKKNIFKTIATLGPLGYLPAPGTVATLATMPIAAALHGYAPAWYRVITILVCIISWIIIDRGLPYFSDADPSSIVIDEVAGTLVALYHVPITILYYVLAFCLFRFFDITKLGGVHFFERLPSATGVLSDDLVAGLWAVVIVQSIVFLS